MLINRRGKRLRQLNRYMLMSGKWLNNSRRRGIVVFERISKLDGSNLRSRKSGQLKWLDRRRQSRYLRCSSAFRGIERACVAFVSSGVRSRGIRNNVVLIHSKQINSHS
jgi:hypothetical protein